MVPAWLEQGNPNEKVTFMTVMKRGRREAFSKVTPSWAFPKRGALACACALPSSRWEE